MNRAETFIEAERLYLDGQFRKAIEMLDSITTKHMTIGNTTLLDGMNTHKNKRTTTKADRFRSVIGVDLLGSFECKSAVRRNAVTIRTRSHARLVAKTHLAEFKAGQQEASKLLRQVFATEPGDQVPPPSRPTKGALKGSQTVDQGSAVTGPHRPVSARSGGRTTTRRAGGRRGQFTFLVTRSGNLVNINLVGKTNARSGISVPLQRVRKEPAKVAYAFTDKFIGPRKVVGNVGSSLYSKLVRMFGKK